MHEIVDRVSGWEGVLTLLPAAGDGSPEISWGDVFFSVAPDGQVPSGQPFATIVTRDHPGEPSAGLDRPGSFRVNIAARPVGGSTATGAGGAVDPTTPDVLMPHPVYAEQGWVAVVDPHERTSDQVVTLLRAAHTAALTRWRRRHGDTGPAEPVPTLGQPDEGPA